MKPDMTALPIAVAIAAAIAVGACGERRDTTAATSASTAPLPTAAPVAPAVAPADRDFVRTAASADMFEIEAGRLALDRSKNDGVRAFAQHIVDDHSKASSELTSLAASEKIEVPSSMAPMHSGDLETLRGLNGRDFDREFAAQAGVAAHQQAVALFDQASREAADPDIKGYAQKQLPALQEHLKTSMALAKAVGVPADRMKSAIAAAESLPSAMSADKNSPEAAATTPAPKKSPSK